MAVDYLKRSVRLSGVVTVEDAEPLLLWLKENPRGKVNLMPCSHLHTAVLQALLVGRATVSAWPTAPDLHALLHNTFNTPS